jgi:hypothetical protein
VQKTIFEQNAFVIAVGKTKEQTFKRAEKYVLWPDFYPGGEFCGIFLRLFI